MGKRKRRSLRGRSPAPEAGSADALAAAKAAALRALDQGPPLVSTFHSSGPVAKKVRFNGDGAPVELGEGSRAEPPHPAEPETASSVEGVKGEPEVDEHLYLDPDEPLPDDAFAEMFEAMHQEFKFYHPEVEFASPGPTNLPRTAAEKRAASVLYYAEPPDDVPCRAKRQVPELTVVRSSRPPQQPLKQTKASRPVVCSSEASGLDEDEFAEVYGEYPPQQPAAAGPGPSQWEHWHFSDDDGGDEAAGDESLHAMDGEQGEVDDNGAAQEADMDSGSPAPSPEPQPPPLPRSTEATPLAAASAAASSPRLSAPTAVAPAPAGSANGTDLVSLDLTPAQQTLLSNALAAQYWAGYHSALLYRGLGLKESAAAKTVEKPEEREGEGWEAGKSAAYAEGLGGTPPR